MKNTDYLGKLTQQRRAREFVGFDIETSGEDNTFVCATLWTASDVFFSDSKEETLHELMRPKYAGKTIVATNLSFDFSGVFWNTPQWHEHDVLFRGSRIMLATLRHGKKGKTEYVDTLNYLPASVEELGKILGLPKLKKPAWLQEHIDKHAYARAPRNREEWRELREYNEMDARISAEFMEFLQAGIRAEGGVLGISIASTALNTWRAGYMPQAIVKEQHHTPGIKEFIYEGYYGGRTEAFTRGLIIDANYYDVNSMYAAVMLNDYPLPQSARRVKDPCIENINLYEGVSRCLVTCPTIQYPLLPVRKDGKLVFPCGNFRGVWNHAELRKALELGYELVVEEQLIYTRTWSPFTKYVRTFYQKRLAAKERGDKLQYVYKSLLTNLYGKFAQHWNEDTKIEFVEHLPPGEFGRRMVEGVSIDTDLVGQETAFVTRTNKECDSAFSFPILSSYTTSYARILLYDLIVSGEAIYTDTDSIITTHELPTSTLLGDLKLEKRIARGVIVKPKLYYDGEIVKAKGIRKPNIEDFRLILEGGRVEKTAFVTIKDGLRRGKSPRSLFVSEKTVGLEDDKRVWPGAFNPEQTQTSAPIVLAMEET